MTKAAVPIIENIKALSKRDEDYDQLLRQVQSLGPLAGVSIGSKVEPGVALYRGTNHHKTVPYRIEEIWFPPADRVLTFNRANRPGVPVFYSCSDRNGAFVEIGMKADQYAVLSRWETTKPLILQDIGYTAAVFTRAGSSRSAPDGYTSFYGRLNPEQREIHEFLSLAFTDPSPSHYRVTAAVAEMFMACAGLSGIIYPAVTKSADVDNYALLPDFVRTGLRLAEAVLTFADDDTRNEIGRPVVARLKASTGGNLEWDFTGPATNILPQDSVTMHLNTGERKHLRAASRVEIAGRMYEVLDGYSFALEGSEIVVRDLQGDSISPIVESMKSTGK